VCYPNIKRFYDTDDAWFTAGYWSCLSAAPWADAPVDDFRLVNLVSVIMLGNQTGRLSYRTVNINELFATAARQMMMVVDTMLVTGGRASGLNSPK